MGSPRSSLRHHHLAKHMSNPGAPHEAAAHQVATSVALSISVSPTGLPPPTPHISKPGPTGPPAPTLVVPTAARSSSTPALQSTGSPNNRRASLHPPPKPNTSLQARPLTTSSGFAAFLPTPAPLKPFLPPCSMTTAPVVSSASTRSIPLSPHQLPRPLSSRTRGRQHCLRARLLRRQHDQEPSLTRRRLTQLGSPPGTCCLPFFSLFLFPFHYFSRLLVSPTSLASVSLLPRNEGG
mmetsp:Transcript_30936/g.78356  ORF Transcript_30936/g.78356 Transcript_30936/m.78356 type:complete len:237 (+) Transcript_30936:183-893(+)